MKAILFRENIPGDIERHMWKRDGYAAQPLPLLVRMHKCYDDAIRDLHNKELLQECQQKLESQIVPDVRTQRQARSLLDKLLTTRSERYGCIPSIFKFRSYNALDAINLARGRAKYKLALEILSGHLTVAKNNRQWIARCITKAKRLMQGRRKSPTRHDAKWKTQIERHLKLDAAIRDPESGLYEAIRKMPAPNLCPIPDLQARLILAQHLNMHGVPQEALKGAVWIWAIGKRHDLSMDGPNRQRIMRFLEKFYRSRGAPSWSLSFVTLVAVTKGRLPRPNWVEDDQLRTLCLDAELDDIPMIMSGVFDWLASVPPRRSASLAHRVQWWVKQLETRIDGVEDRGRKNELLSMLYRVYSYSPHRQSRAWGEKWLAYASKEHLREILPHWDKWFFPSTKRFEIVDRLYRQDPKYVSRYIDQLGLPNQQRNQILGAKVVFGKRSAKDYSIFKPIADAGALKKRLTIHGHRRCALFIGAAIWACQSEKTHRYGGLERKNRTKARALVGAHSSILPALESWDVEGRVWSSTSYQLSHLAQLTNSTVALPKWVNDDIDSTLEGGSAVKQTLHLPRRVGDSRYDLLVKVGWKKLVESKKLHLRAIATRIVNWVSAGDLTVEQGVLDFLIAKYMVGRALLNSKPQPQPRSAVVTWHGVNYVKGLDKGEGVTWTEGVIAELQVLDDLLEFENHKPMRLKPNVIFTHVKERLSAASLREIRGEGGWFHVVDKDRYYSEYQANMRSCEGGACPSAKTMLPVES